MVAVSAFQRDEIRPIDGDDLEAVVAIDRAHTKYSRRRFFEKRFAQAAAHPAEFVEDFIAAGADWVSFHAEVTRHPGEILGLIRSEGKRAGLVISPQTPSERLFDYLELLDFTLVMTVVPGFGGQKIIPEALEKVSQIKEEAARQEIDIEVEVDGGVKTENLEQVVAAGTDIVVVGSSIYAATEPRQAALDIREILDGAS